MKVSKPKPVVKINVHVQMPNNQFVINDNF